MIMKNQLLNLKMIALMCLMMVLGGANVWAEQYKIVFAKNPEAPTNLPQISKSTSISDVISSGANYVSSFGTLTKAYYNSKEGIKLGSTNKTSGSGTFELKIDNAYQKNIKKLTVKSVVYDTSDATTLQVYSGSTSLKKNIPLGEDFVYTFETPTTVPSVKIVTSPKRAYISEIILETAEANNPTLVASESELDFGSVENNTSKDLTFKLSGKKLTDGASLSVDGEYFTVTPTSVAQTDGTIAETDVTVSYKPTAVGSHTATLTISSTGATDKTITLTGTSANAYNVAWSVNGKEYSEGTPTTKVVDGEKVTVLPTAPSDINGKVFVGWTNASLSVAQDAAPAVLFKNVVNAPKVTGDVTYYAVFANRTDGGEVTYTKLTSDQFKTDATYVIGAEQSATNNTMWYFNGNVDKEWGRMSSTTSIESLMRFTLSGSASALVVKGENGKYLSTSSSSGKFYEMSLEETKVILGIDGTIKTLDETLSLRHNYTSTGGGIRWYSGNTGVSAYFYEVNEGYIYSGYCTTVEAAAEPTYTAQTLTFIAKDGADYYATFSSDKVTFITSKHVIPYVVTVANGKIDMKSEMFKSEKTTIESAEVDGYYIPANTGILLYSDAENVDYYTVENKTVDAISPVNNMLEPAPKDGGNFAFNEGYKYYKLAYNNYKEKTGLGFYWGANNGGAFYVKGGTAYLKVLVAKTAGAKGFTLNGEATGIEGVNANVENAKAIYNLNGQRVASMAKPGLYIVNGKKVVRK